MGYAPFGIATVNGKLYVSYAKQDADAGDDVRGKGLGFISVFETNGHFVGRLASRGDLNAPWGMVQAPANFGDFSNALLVGNFGDGRIHAYNAVTGKELGILNRSPGHPLEIDGLWGLAFGNGKTAGGANTLYYAAGTGDEAHGLFGKITANPIGTNPVTAALSGGDLIITGSRDSDHVEVRLGSDNRKIVVEAGGQRIGSFDAAAVGTIQFRGFAENDFFQVDARVTALVIADGGAGNDQIISGAGSNILLGGSGNDLLIGGRGRDILIGGDGKDQLFGASDSDLLVGGRTAYDSDLQALLQIMTTWNGATSYSDQVSAIRTGKNGVRKLDSSTVLADTVRDYLFGGDGLDWFLGTLPDVFYAKQPNEQVF